MNFDICVYFEVKEWDFRNWIVCKLCMRTTQTLIQMENIDFENVKQEQNAFATGFGSIL